MGCSYGNCEGNDKLPFDCRRCGQSFCSDHRLPEKHNCPGNQAASTEAWFPKSADPSKESSSPSWWRIALVLLVVGSILSVVGFVAGYPSAVPSVDSISGSENPVDAGGTPEPTSTSSNGQSSSAESDDRLSEEEVERLIHEAVNDYRAERGVSKLTYDDGLAEIARYHSSNMADDGDIYHTSPDGQSVDDRYERFGYDCRVPVGDGKYRTSGENVAKTWYEEDLTNEEYYDTPEELAKGVVEQWINSPEHRDNLVDDAWRKEGIGVTVVEEDGNTAVYVTQNFC